MRYRELFHEITSYGEFDRMPVIHWGGWEETRARWIREGLPPDKSEHEFFDAVPHWYGVGVYLGVHPQFEREVLEETKEYRIIRDGNGVVSRNWIGKSCIPHYTDWALKGAKEWPEFKKRLQPDPTRVPRDLDKQIAAAEASGLPIVVQAGSLMGWTRDWMGVVNYSYLMYDDREVFSDMVDTLSDLVCWGLDQVLPKVKADMAHGWEDMCGRNGPLVSPAIFDECVAPGYRKIRNKLEEYGVKLYSIDSDGDVTDLVGHWLDAGVNGQFPIEVGPFKGDARYFRRKYGKELFIMGNFDKLALEKGHAAIRAEIERLLPLMKEGGFIMMPDHGITPGVSLEDYRWYLEQVRQLRF